MKQQRLSPEEQKKYRQQMALKKKLEETNHKLLNKQFKKSFFFISSLSVRLLYILLFVIVVLFHDKSSGLENEVVLNHNYENSLSSGKYGKTSKERMLYIETDKDEYNINVTGRAIPEFEINDTLLMERNIFGKPIFFTKEGWSLKYRVPVNYLYYCIILVFTLFTLFLTDGPSKFISGILIFTMVLNVMGILGYFLF